MPTKSSASSRAIPFNKMAKEVEIVLLFHMLGKKRAQRYAR
jgi:hypothetical protein